MTKFFDNYKSRKSYDFKYLIVPEFHDDGAIHFHGLVKGIRPDDLIVPEKIWYRDRQTQELQQVPNRKGYVDWKSYSDKFGWFSCSKIKHYEACARYVSKYITKDMKAIPMGQRLFMASKNLKRPELVFDSDDVPMFAKPDYENEFIKIKDSGVTYGLLPDWYDECSSDLRDEVEPLPDLEEQIFERLTGEQLRMDVEGCYYEVV